MLQTLLLTLKQFILRSLLREVKNGDGDDGKGPERNHDTDDPEQWHVSLWAINAWYVIIRRPTSGQNCHVPLFLVVYCTSVYERDLDCGILGQNVKIDAELFDCFLDQGAELG